MPFKARQEIYGLILQSSMAEALAAFRAGKISNNPDTCIVWSWYNLDAQGRKEMAEEDLRTLKRRQEIEVGSINRCAVSGEDSVSMIVSLLVHERCRHLAGRPCTLEAED